VNEVVDTSTTSARTAIRNDILLLTGILFNLLWPWVWFVILKSKGGIQLSSGWARYILGHTQQLSAIVTLIGSLNSIATTFLFGCAVSRYGQEFIVARTKQQIPPTVFDVSTLLAFRHMSVMWGVEDLGQLFSKRRRMVTVGLLLVVLGGSALVPSGTASLVTPVTFNRMRRVTQKEMDFASSDRTCSQNVIPYDTDRMLDVLDSGKVCNIPKPSNFTR
jgi:hypothetical protein